MRALVVLIACAVAAGCELREIVTTDSDDVVIAEIVLRAGAPVQTALLHRTYRDAVGPGDVPGARIEVTNAAGQILSFTEVPDSVCIAPGTSETPPRGTCYQSTNPSYSIIPGESYALRIQLQGGGIMTATTRVPSPFQIARPATAVCSLPLGTTLTITWRAAPGAWVYGAESTIHGLAPFLEPQGIKLPEDPLRLFGLSISSQDTTIVFPTEFGLFQRFDADLTNALVLLQGGFPTNVVADLAIGAADRNYVNWERGGNFNPSGFVRVGSIRGDGAGVFGSMVPLFFQVHVGSSQHPAC